MSAVSSFLVAIALRHTQHRRLQRQHQHFNTLLNKLKLDNKTNDISYEHLHLIDNFYMPDSGHEKIRVTRDEKTGLVRACVRKVRLGDLNIYSPKRFVDWRVSVNMEIPGTLPSLFLYYTLVFLLSLHFLFHLRNILEDMLLILPNMRLQYLRR